MGVLLLRMRSHWRGRRPSLIALTLLVGLVGTVVLGSLAGSRRTRSSVDRFAEATKVLDAFVMFRDHSKDHPNTVLDLREVEDGARFAFMYLFVDSGFIGFMASVDGDLGIRVNRDFVVAGRAPHPGAPLEIAISETLSRDRSLEVGDEIRTYSPSAEQAVCFSENVENPPPEEFCAPLYQAFSQTGGDPSAFAGPDFAFRVVGITRGPFDIAQNASAVQIVTLDRSFFEMARDEVPWGAGVLVHFAEGVSDADFERALFAVVDPGELGDLSTATAPLEALHTRAAVVANGLLVFAGVSALAGLVTIAQALARQTALGASDRQTLRSLGMGSAGRVLDAVVTIVPVGVGGATLAALGAWALSSAMPLGSARELEVNRGMSFDAAVLVGGAAALAVFTVAIALVGLRVWRRLGRRRVVSAVPLGSVPATVGARFALDPGRGRRAVPIRVALSGAALGVAGVLAAATFGGALGRLVDDPTRFGYGWDALVNGEPDSSTSDEPANWDEEDARVAAHPDVAAASRVWLGMRAQVDGHAVPAFSQQALAGGKGGVDAPGIPIVAGRAPSTAGEVALGAKTMARSHVGIGDGVDVAGHELEVVGQAIFPATIESYPLADGALFDDSVVEQGDFLESGDAAETRLAVRLNRGSDRAAALRRLATVNGGAPPAEPIRPFEVEDLAQLRSLPTLFSAFMILVAALALAHALILTVRRRAGDLAVVRALGLTRGESVRVVGWQAAIVAMLGVVVGAPVGVLTGRFVWQSVADSYGIHTDAVWPFLTLVLVVPVTLAAVLIIAWWPARRAARLVPAQVLRTE